MCVPVRRRCSRRKWTRSTRGSTFALRALPFTVIEIWAICALSKKEAPSLPQKSRDKSLIFDVDSCGSWGVARLRIVPRSKILPWVSWMLDGIAIRRRSLSPTPTSFVDGLGGEDYDAESLGLPMLGTRITHYDIIRPLGSGGMGVVYEAEDTRLGRRVALKFLLPALDHDLKALERFQREARAASALNHPNICTVYAIEQHDAPCSPPNCPGEHFIVMELLEGETLAQMIDRHHRFDLTHLLDIGMQITDALESAHAKGIVHRDIKPAHVFLSPRGQVKILDFGIAQIEGARAIADSWGSEAETTRGQDLTVPGTAIGTVAYMSPEQARGWLT